MLCNVFMSLMLFYQSLYYELWTCPYLFLACYFWFWKSKSEAYSEPSRKLKMVPFAKIVNSWKPLTIFAKAPSYIFGFWIHLCKCCLSIVSASNYCTFFEKTFLNLFFLITVWCTAVWPTLREEKNTYQLRKSVCFKFSDKKFK